MPSIKGTASIVSSAAEQKLLRSTKFPPSFSQQVDISKVNTSVFTMWVEKEIERILGFEDEIVASMAINLFFPKVNTDDIHAPATYGTVDPRKAQLDLVGFLGEDEASKFASELWEMMIDAQNQPKGIPRILIEQKKAEIAAQKNNSSSRNEGIGSKSFNPLMEEASRRAEMARQVFGKQRQHDQQQNQNQNQPRPPWNHGEEKINNGARPVSPQNSVQQGKDDSRKISSEECNRRESKSRSRSESRMRKNRHEGHRVQSSDESSSSSLDSYGRRRYRNSSSKRRRDKDYDRHNDDRDRGRRSRKSSRRSKRSRSRSRERSSRRSSTSRSNYHRSDRDRRYDEFGSERKYSRRRNYSRSSSRSSRRDKSRSESSRSSRGQGR